MEVIAAAIIIIITQHFHLQALYHGPDHFHNSEKDGPCRAQFNQLEELHQ